MSAPLLNGHHRRREASSSRDRRVLPHSADAEASVLGGVILKPELIGRLDTLEVEDFYDSRHRIIWGALRTVVAARIAVDVVTLEAQIEREGKLEAVGGIAYLGELALRVPTSDNVVHYADEVRLKARHRRAIVKLAEATERAWTWPHEPDDLVIEIAGELARDDRAQREAAAQRARWCVPLTEYLGDAEPDEDDADDWIIRDIIPRGEPALWGGPMKGGKTWGALDLAIAAALGRPWLQNFGNTVGRPIRVLGLFLEDSKRRLRRRLWELTRSRGITPNDGTLGEHLRISRASLRLPDRADQRRITAEIKEWGAALVIADNLTRIMVGDPNSTREAAAFTKAWTEIVEETGAAWLFLHHTRKPSGAQDPKLIDPFDLLRGSGDFGATARNIIVTTPIRTEDGDTAHRLSEVRMRGNLELRRESFTLGFERLEFQGRWQVRLHDKGEIEDTRTAVKQQRSDSREARRKAELAAELSVRRSIAIAIATREGTVTQARLATELGLRSPRSVATVLEDLVHTGVLVCTGRRGYEISGKARQTEMP